MKKIKLIKSLEKIHAPKKKKKKNTPEIIKDNSTVERKKNLNQSV